MFSNPYKSGLSHDESLAAAIYGTPRVVNAGNKENVRKFIKKLSDLYSKDIDAEKEYKTYTDFIIGNKDKLINLYKIFGDNAMLYLESLMASSPLPIERFFSTYVPIKDNISQKILEIFSNIKKYPGKAETGKLAGLFSIISSLSDEYQTQFFELLHNQNQLYQQNKNNNAVILLSLEVFSKKDKAIKMSELNKAGDLKFTEITDFIHWVHARCLNIYLLFLGMDQAKIDVEKLDALSIERLMQLAAGIMNLRKRNMPEYITLLIEMLKADLSKTASFNEFSTATADTLDTQLGGGLSKHNMNCVLKLKEGNIDIGVAFNYIPEKKFSYQKDNARHPTLYSIKQWDKNNIETIFLGDDLSCCAATNGDYFYAVLERRMDKSCFMHVIINENTQEPVCGNWLYFAKNKEGKIYVVANFTEIRSNSCRDAALRDKLVKELCRYSYAYAKAIGAQGFLLRELTYGSIPDFNEPDISHLLAETKTLRPGLVYNKIDMSVEKVGGFYDVKTMKTTHECVYYLKAEEQTTFYQPPTMTQLHMAVEDGDVVAATLLLERKEINPNALDSYDRTALHLAIKYNQVQMIKLLFEHGAKLNEKDIHDDMLFSVAILNGNLEIVHAFIKGGVNLDREHRLMPLFMAARKGYFAIVHALLKAGAESLQRDEGDMIVALYVTEAEKRLQNRLNTTDVMARMTCINDAILYCREAMKVNPDNVECRKSAASAYYQLGLEQLTHNALDNAAGNFINCMTLDPDKKEYRENAENAYHRIALNQSGMFPSRANIVEVLSGHVAVNRNARG